MGSVLTTTERRKELARKRARFDESGAQDTCVFPGGSYLMTAMINSTFIPMAAITTIARRYMKKRELVPLIARRGNRMTNVLSSANTNIE